MAEEIRKVIAVGKECTWKDLSGRRIKVISKEPSIVHKNCGMWSVYFRDIYTLDHEQDHYACAVRLSKKVYKTLK